jgi:hypothetical protein
MIYYFDLDFQFGGLMISAPRAQIFSFGIYSRSNFARNFRFFLVDSESYSDFRPAGSLKSNSDIDIVCVVFSTTPSAQGPLKKFRSVCLPAPC